MLHTKGFDTLTDEQKTYVNEIDKSNERMIGLVDSLLDISRIESGRLIVDPKMTSLEDLMLTTINDFDGPIKG